MEPHYDPSSPCLFLNDKAEKGIEAENATIRADKVSHGSVISAAANNPTLAKESVINFRGTLILICLKE